MRKINNKLHIIKANLLAEQRYLETKDVIEEDWKTNVAAGLAAAAGGISGAQAQQHVDPSKPAVTQQVQGQVDKAFGDKVANPFNASDTFANTPKIVGIQTGVTDGRTGKSGVYVYHNRLPSDPNFNPKTDREIVYSENLPNLRKTKEYKEYMMSKQGGQGAPSAQNQVAVNETARLKKSFVNVFNSIKRDDENTLIIK